MRILLALVALLAGFQIMTAIPARPGRTVYVQPDGTKIAIRQFGDEFGHWTVDDTGRLVALAPDGYYRPVQGTSIDAIRRNSVARRAAARQNRAARRAKGDPIAIGQKHFLVILVEFKDKQFAAGENAKAEFTALLNEQGYSKNGGTGSARDFYYDNSHGLFEPVFDVYGPVQMDTTMAYYGQNDWNGNDMHPEEALIAGCQKLDEEIDFTRYDNDGDGRVDLVFMYYAGKGEADGGSTNTIWPHQWEIGFMGVQLDGKLIDSYACTSEQKGSGQMCGIGTACHEFAHAMGLPDFYDADYATNGQSAGLFFFSTMDSGPYNNDGRTPPYFNIEERIMLGWLNEDAIQEFPKSGTYTLPSINENVAYKTLTDQPGEYFLYECRGSNGWDAGLLSHGLVVYHVDKSDRLVEIKDYYGNSRTYSAQYLWENWRQDNAVNENGSHPCFYVVPSADQENLLFGHFMYWGNYYFDENNAPRIPFPGSDNISFYTPKSWNGYEGPMALRQISYADDLVTLQVYVPSGDINFVTIADAGSYHPGDRFTFELVRPDEAEAPASVAWYYDDEPAGADSVTLTAGSHTVDARLTYSDGRQAVLTLEIEVE